MWIAIVPAYNEAQHIKTVLQNLLSCDFQLIILVANGCKDQTEEYALQARKKTNLKILSFPEPLGLDIPRAIGAAYAKKYHPQGIVFIDGDMGGEITPAIYKLLQGLKKGLDLALTNCYPFPDQLSDLAANVLKHREIVNKKLGLFPRIGYATPSHGPHAISARLLAQIPVKALAIPPLTLAYASLNHFQVGVAASISHKLLGSTLRSTQHAQNIADTIIGDCLQTLAYLEDSPLEEILPALPFPVALSSDPDSDSVYRKARRFDILESFLSTLPPPF